MEFSTMVWSGGNVLNSSIFGVLDKANPIGLPSICDRGFWESYRTIREDRFKFAAEAKNASRNAATICSAAKSTSPKWKTHSIAKNLTWASFFVLPT
jgi:hypothetical protein